MVRLHRYLKDIDQIFQNKNELYSFDVEENLGCVVPDNHDSFPWLVEWACATVNLGRVGVDGKTAFELRVGRRWRQQLPCFGERVAWLPVGKHVSRAVSNWNITLKAYFLV